MRAIAWLHSIRMPYFRSSKEQKAAFMIANIIRNKYKNFFVSSLVISILIIACSETAGESLNEDKGQEVNSANFTDGFNSGSSQSTGMVDSGEWNGIPVSSDAYRAYPSGIRSYENFEDVTNSGIWVTGQGALNIPADIALISLGVESREKTVSQARDKAAEVMENVINAITKNDVSEDEIVTTNFNIYPQTTWIEVSDSLGRHTEPRIIGYTVNNTVEVRVNEIDNLSQVIDGAVSSGGDLVRVNSIQFTVDDTSIYAEKIRQMAAADALAKAEVYAQAMGVNLGPLVYLIEHANAVPMGSEFSQPEMLAMDGAMMKSTPISSGDVGLTVSVQAAFAIAE